MGVGDQRMFDGVAKESCFFDMTPPDLAARNRLYPKAYIHDLIAYAGSLPVGVHTVRAFKELKKQEAERKEGSKP